MEIREGGNIKRKKKNKKNSSKSKSEDPGNTALPPRGGTKSLI